MNLCIRCGNPYGDGIPSCPCCGFVFQAASAQDSLPAGNQLVCPDASPQDSLQDSPESMPPVPADGAVDPPEQITKNPDVNPFEAFAEKQPELTMTDTQPELAMTDTQPELTMAESKPEILPGTIPQNGPIWSREAPADPDDELCREIEQGTDLSDVIAWKKKRAQSDLPFAVDFEEEPLTGLLTDAFHDLSGMGIFHDIF